MEHRTSRYSFALACICLVLFLAGRPLAADEKVLFDFENDADLAVWSQFLPDNPKIVGAKEPPVKIELSGENAASGKRCLKLTFSGGKYPTVATHSPLEDWTVYNSFKADVTASRTCLIAFRVVRKDDKEHRGWVKLALLHQGRNAVVDVAPMPRGLDNGRPLKGPTQFEIIMYAPHEGEAIFVDNIRVSTEVPDTATPPHGEHVTPGDKARFYPKLGKIPVLGLGIEVESAAEFGKQMMEHWVRPADKTVEQVEAEFRTLYDGLKKEHPRAVMAIFRNAQKGFDPAAPEKEYAGWESTAISAHGPNAVLLESLHSFCCGKRIPTGIRFRMT